MQDPRPLAGGDKGGGGAPSMSFDAEAGARAHHDQTDLAGIKDGFTLTNSTTADTGLQRLDPVRLAIKCPSLPDQYLAESSIVVVPRTNTIAQVKQQIERTWKGRPRPDGMRLFKSGQMLSDEMRVASIVESVQREDEAATPIHLVIRPGAWADPKAAGLADLLRRTSSQSTATRSTPISSVAGAGLSVPSIRHTFPYLQASQGWHSPMQSAQGSHLASIIEAMEPSQYATFQSMLSWVHAHYTDLYEEAWNKAYGTAYQEAIKDNPMTPALNVQELADQVGCTSAEIIGLIEDVQRDILAWDSIESEVSKSETKMPYTYEQTQIDGLPYLLRIERSEHEDLLRILLRRMEKLRDIMHQMDKLINYQSLLDRTMVSPPEIVDAVQAADRRPGNSLVRAQPTIFQSALQRLSLLQAADVADIMMNFTFLAVKMGIMVYVFTRGASAVKTGVIAGLACAYVTFEAYKMTQRRLHIRVRAIRQALGRSETQRQADGGGGVDAQAVPMSRHPSRAHDEAQSRSSTNSGEQAIAAPQSPVQYRIASPILLEFWIERVALWNLAEEDEELGFQPAAGRPRQAVRRRHGRSTFLGGLNDYVFLPIVLFIATLVPAVEQKRRRAIDLRDDLVRSVARKHEEQVERLQKSNRDEDGSSSSGGGDKKGIEVINPPPFLQTTYAQDILRRRTEGRQIDIGQELDAAAAANGADDVEDGMDQVDMGFI